MMEARQPSKLQLWLERLYVTALRIYPRDLRRRFGRPMIEAFRDGCNDAGHSGRSKLLVHGMRAVFELLVEGMRARVARLPRGVRADAQRHGVERLESRELAGTERDRAVGMRRDLIGTLSQDIRGALRTMRRTPAFTLVALVTLALGIGANVAMFSTAHSALLKPLPFVEPQRLVMGRTGTGGGYVSAPDYFDYRNRMNTFENLGSIMPFGIEYTITGGENPERVAGTAVSANLFATLGVMPQLGRDFTEADGQVGAPDVVLISHGYRQRRFGGSSAVVGTTLMINGAPFTVVGVMPANFSFLADVDFWRPMRPDRDAANLRDRHNWFLVGRLASGVTIDQARNEADVISAQLATAYPATNEGMALSLVRLQTVLVADYRTRLFVLTAALGLVLLMACANITAMLLSRAPTRRVELSIKSALGASNVRLVQQMLVETLVLAAFGGILGTACAIWMQRMILAFLQLDLPGVGEASLSVPMLVMALVVSLAAGISAGVYPALNAARGNLADDLKAGARVTSGAGTGFRSVLIVAQVALSIVLLIGSGLLMRSFFRVRTVNPGFDAANLLTAEIALPRTRYSEPEQRIEFFTRLLEETGNIPGVISAGLANSLPFRGRLNGFTAHASDNPDDERSVLLRSVLPGYFETMRIPLLAGRALDQTVATDGPPVAVINGKAAQAFFADGNPIGRRLVLDFFGSPIGAEVVGVAGDVRMQELTAVPQPAVYLSYRQLPYLSMQIAVRTATDETSVPHALRGVVLNLDKNIPLAGLATMDDAISESIGDRKAIALALTLYAALPLILAGVGLYAVLAYYVNHRSHEIGVRIALGADTTGIAAMILRRGTSLVLIGVTIGSAGAVGLTQLIRQMLFGIEPNDISTFVGAAVFVLAIALIACLIPALRAVRVDPMAALQAE